MANITFDGENRVINISDADDVDPIEVYSRWKEWAMKVDNLKWPPAMKSTGGDPLPAGFSLSSTIIVLNGWNIKTNNAYFSGVLAKN